MPVYYNEIEPYPAQWLRNLIKAGHIPDGEVDERSIVDVRPEDLRGFDQCHFFAGIAGWSRALRLAGWPDDRPVWTGSCPCQPFSVAGRGKGTADERHLWPAFFDLIRECRPAVVFGEQVASRAGREWLAGVFTDLESVGYAGAGADLCAAGIGAPHIRQRLYWVALANADSQSIRGRRSAEITGASGTNGGSSGQQRVWADARHACDDVADADSPERRAVSEGRRHDDDRSDAGRQEAPGRHQFHRAGDMVNAASIGRREGWPEHELRGGRAAIASASGGDVGDAESVNKWRDGLWDAREDGAGEAGGSGVRDGDMADADDAGREGRNVLPERPDELSPWSRGVEWRRGADGKERRVKSGVRLLVDGVPGRVGRLRAYGNAIVPPLAAKVIEAVMEMTE